MDTRGLDPEVDRLYTLASKALGPGHDGYLAAAFAAALRARNANWMAFLTAGSHNVRARAPTTTIAKCSISHTGRALEPSPHASVKTIPLFTRGEQS